MHGHGTQSPHSSPGVQLTGGNRQTRTMDSDGVGGLDVFPEASVVWGGVRLGRMSCGFQMS